MSWGVEPDAMIGHSIGEYVAACIAGVSRCDDALGSSRGAARLMQDDAHRRDARRARVGRRSSAPS